MNDQELLRLAYEQALRSPDPSTQNGAFLYYDGMPLTVTFACNEFPRGVAYTEERWERPLKYSLIEHAERNAIYSAARYGLATKGTTLVCPWAACADCARAIVQAGITCQLTRARVGLSAEINARWAETCALGDQILSEGGVAIRMVDGAVDGPKVRRDGVLVAT